MASDLWFCTESIQPSKLAMPVPGHPLHEKPDRGLGRPACGAPKSMAGHWHALSHAQLLRGAFRARNDGACTRASLKAVVEPPGNYRVPVPATAAPGQPGPSHDELALRSIRDALLPEDVGDFDREFRAVMSEATETLDLTGVVEFRRRWHRVAWSSADPQSHRRMLSTVDELNAGEAVATEP